MLTFSAKFPLSVLILAMFSVGLGFAQTPDVPYIDLVAPPSLPTGKSVVWDDGWSGQENPLVSVDMILEVVSPSGTRIEDGDDVIFKAKFRHHHIEPIPCFFGLSVGIDDQGNGSVIEFDSIGIDELTGTPLDEEVWHEIETPVFEFNFDAHTRIVNGRPVLNIYTTANPVWGVLGGGPNDQVLFIDILATYACTSEVVCPPFPVCGDEDIGYFSSFSLPSELAGKHRTTDYAPKTSAAAGCTSCAGGGSAGQQLPTLDISRLMSPSNQDSQGNLSLGMYFSFDYRINYYPDPNNPDVLLLFDPGTGRTLYFDNDNTANSDEFLNKIVAGTNVVEAHNVFDRIEMSDTNSDGVNDTVTVYRRGGMQYEFELVEVDSVQSGRITKIIDTTIDNTASQKIDFEYEFTPTQSSGDPAGRLKIDKIIDAYGMEARMTYRTGTINGRHVIEEIEIYDSSTLLTTLNYEYTSDQLTRVTRKTGTAAAIEISSYEYSTDSNRDTIKTVELNGSVPEVKKVHLSQNYAQNGSGLSIVFAGILQGVSDGTDHEYLSIWQSNPLDGRYNISYRGRQMKWSPGQYLKYYDENGDPEEFYPQHPSTGDGTSNNQAEQILLGRPTSMRTESGMLVELTYDSQGNVTSKVYNSDINGNDDNFEQWVYDEQSRELFYKDRMGYDRMGYVTLTERDMNGNPVRVVQGLVITGPGGTIPDTTAETGDPDTDTVPVETKYGYYDTTNGSGAFEGLLAWSGKVVYDAPGEPAAAAKTIYNYDSNGRLETIEKPEPPGAGGRPTVVNHWTGGDLVKVTNELSHDTEFLYDSIGRLIQTTYEDGTTEAARFTVGDTSSSMAEHHVDRKNRKGVVQRMTYDNAGRMTAQIAAFAIDNGYLSDETVWAVNSGGQSLLPANESPRSEYTYLLGQTQRQSAKQNGGITTYFYDYRGRNDLMLTMANESHCVHDAQTYAQNRLFMTERRIGLLQGDLNLDGTVNLLDIDLFTSLLSGDFGELPPFLADAIADMNGDGIVDLLDVSGFIKSLSGSESIPVISRSYQVYNAIEQHVRIVRSANLDVTPHQGGTPAEINTHLISLLRPIPTSSPNPDFVIEDAVRDIPGNLIQVINGLGTIQQSEFDGLGREIRRTSDLGVIGLASKTTYDAYGNVSETQNIDTGLKTGFAYLPVETGYLYEQTVAVGGGVALQATTRYEYDASGRQTKVIGPDPNGNPVPGNGTTDFGRTTSTFYQDACCGQYVGVRDALGHGRITHRNSAGEQIHSAVVENYDPAIQNANNRLSESTSRYRPDGRMEFQTAWTIANQVTIGNVPPPIAGVPNYDNSTGPAANTGVTTRYLYDYDLTDGVGLDASTGQSFTRLTGGSGSVSLSTALTKLLTGIQSGQGGAGISFTEETPGRATAIVSPDEKTVRFTISDGIGRSVMSGLLTGPAAPDEHTPGDPAAWNVANVLMDWTCTRYDQVVAVGMENWVETTTVDQNGKTRKSRANGAGWAISSFDELGNETTTAFDAGGNARVVTQTGQMMTYGYDSLSRKIKTTDNTLGDLETETTYQDGRIKTQIDAKDQTMTYLAYDVLDRPLDIQDRLSHVTKRRYNIPTISDDFVDTVEDATGKVTTYTLDKLGRRMFVDLDNEQRTEFVYDAAGRQSEIRYFADKDDNNPIARRTYTYASPSGTLEQIVYFEDENIDGNEDVVGTDLFDYNDVLQRDLATQHDGDEQSPVKHQLDWDYTLRGQIFKETTTYATQPYVVENRFDPRGRLAKVIYPSNREVDYTYTERSEVDTIDWNGSQIEDRGYTALGQLETIARNGISGTESRSYNGRRLTQVDATNLGVGTIDYTYDFNHNKEKETFSGNSVLDIYDFDTTTNGYDAEDRFVRFDRPDPGLNEINVEFKRSPGAASIGNIVDITGGAYVGLREFNDIHQLGGAGVTNPTQSFDDVGNLTAAENGNSYAWNMAAGRMNSATVPSTPVRGIAGTHGYGFDATGRRVWKEVSSTKTVYIYSGPNCIAEYNEGAVFSTPGNEYVYAGGIDSLAMVVHNNNAKRFSVIRNQQWSVIGLVNIVTATIEELYSYNVFGERTILDPGTANSRTASSFNNPYGYTSRRHDDETGMMYFRARFYDPTTGEFLSKDPGGYVDGYSLYRGYFVPNNVDPSGLVWQHVSGTIYKAEGEEDSLMSLAWKITKNNDDWVCIWPIKDRKLWSGYPWAKPCAKADVRNLVAKPKKTVLMRARETGVNDDFMRGVDRVWGNSEYIWDTPRDAVEHIRDESRQGAKPIGLLLAGNHHFFDNVEINQTDASQISKLFFDVATEKSNRRNSYKSAVRKIGPPRCWFTRNSSFYLFTCNGHPAITTNLAQNVMRKTSSIFGYDDIVEAEWNGRNAAWAWLDEARRHRTWKSLIKDEAWIKTPGTQ